MNYLVVGTGPAGLTAAYLLARRGHKVALVVGDDPRKTGGLWRGFDYAVDHERTRTPLGVHGHFIHFETGMHWACECGVPEIDDFWRGLLTPAEIDEIPREIAGCFWNGKLQTNSPYPDVRGGGEFSNRPILEKLWGVPLKDLAPGADRLIKIDRVVAYDEERTRKLYEAEPASRQHIAWPDQRTLPLEYRSGRSSFYPKGGLAALVDTALLALGRMGVKFQSYMARDDDETTVIWAAGLKSACQHAGLMWPGDMHPPRRLTLVNLLLPDERPPHDLHYAFDYSGRRLFRQTWYKNFAPRGPNRMSLEILGGDDVEFVRTMNPHSMVLGIHDLGPVLPVPTTHNEQRLELVRAALGQLPHLKLVGAGAKAGLFFQPEVLQHVAEVCA